MSSAPASPRPVTVPDFRAAKGARKLAVVTAYDYTAAKLADDAGVDAILVGDSLGMVVQGHATTLPVTLAQMVYHTTLVARGSKRPLILADLPFGSYGESPRQAVRSAFKLLKAGAVAVKLEGGERAAESVAACVRADVPVMGHIGLTPQSIHQLGGFKVQRDLKRLLEDAKTVEQAGAFALIVEGVPNDLGAAVTAAVGIPTIGIGAGPGCDGQVLVWHDMLGLFEAFRPKFVKQYANLAGDIRNAIRNYCVEVRDGIFPGPDHGFK